MKLQFNHSYDVDHRHATVKRAIDDSEGQNFLRVYVENLRKSGWPRYPAIRG